MTQENRVACPDTSQLLDYLQGRVENHLLNELESHLQACNDCGATMRGLSDNDTIGDLVNQIASRQTSDFGDESEQSFVKNLVERIQSKATPAMTLTRDRAYEVSSRLTPSATSLGKIAQYEVLRVLGVGSTSVVYQARDTQLDRLVALKILRPSVGDAAQTRFMSEARSAASIEHPNVVTIYQVGQSDGLAFIAMKWVPGETLESRLKNVTCLDQDTLFPIMQQICSGLTVAHQRNLIHRDLKPANIWLSEETNSPIILDFGLARIADDDPHLTATGMIAGTPNFMSPEQAKGFEIDGRSDLFSLGCVMYRALTGKLPFGGNGILSTLQAIQLEQPKIPTEVNPHILQDTSDLVMCLLEKQPANRPENTAQLERALSEPRGEWEFNVPRHTIHQAGFDRSQTPPKSKTGNRVWLKGLFIAALCAVMLCVYQRENLIRIVTNHGVLEIEANDEQVKIEILQNGDLIRVLDTATNQNLDIKAGSYDLKIRNPQIGIELSADTIAMSRGSKVIVRVRKRTQPSLDANEKSATIARKEISEPVYEGKSIAQWLRQLKFETSEVAIGNAIRAVGRLAESNPNIQDEAISVITPSVRRYGSDLHRNGGLAGDFCDFFNRMEAERTFAFIERELRTGTLPSRKQCQFLVYLTYPLDSNSSAPKPKLGEYIHQNRDQLMQAAFRWMNSPSEAERKWALEFLGNLFGRFYRRVDNSKTESKLNRLAYDHPLIAAFEKEYWKHLQKPESFGLAHLMVQFGVLQQPFVTRIVDEIRDERATKANREKAFEICKYINGSTSEPVVKLYMEILENGPVARLIGKRKSFASGTREIEIFGKMRGNTSFMSPRETTENFLILKAIVIDRLGDLGYAAKNSRDAIKRYEQHDQLKIFAKDAITKIDKAITDISNAPMNTASKTSSFPAPNRLPQYDGRNFEQWLSLLAVERNDKTVARGLVAISQLMEKVEQQKRAIVVVRKIVRRSGSAVVESNDSISNSIVRFFSKVEPDLFFEFIKTELKFGNAKSNEQLRLLILLTLKNGFNSIRHKDPTKLLKTGQEIQLELLQLCFRDQSFGTLSALQESVYSFQSLASLPGTVGPNTTQEKTELWKAKIGIALRALEKANSLDKKVLIVGLLVSQGYESDSLAKLIERALADETTLPIALKSAYDISNVWKSESASIFVPALVSLYSNTEKLKTISKQVTTRSLSRWSNEDLIRVEILQNLERLGSFAEAAVPFLKRLKKRSSFSSVVIQALTTIQSSIEAKAK